MYGIALRDSGKFDLYWDMTLVDSPENGKFSLIRFNLLIVTIFDVSISFDTMYFWPPNGQIKQLSTKGHS
jgi:hypothetical protein